MTREHTLPGYVAIALAVLFPVYWFTALWYGLAAGSFSADITRLGPMDGLFVLIGGMEIYLYLSLRRIIKNQLQGGVCAVLLLIMAIAAALLTATVLFDLGLSLSGEFTNPIRDSLVVAASAWFMVTGFILGLTGLALSIALLVTDAGSATTLKVFAVMLLISSLLALSIILSPLSFVTYPVAFLTLGIFFLRGGYEAEVV